MFQAYLLVIISYDEGWTTQMKVLRWIMPVLLAGLVILTNGYVVSAQIVTTQDGTKFDAQYYAITNPEIVATYGDSFEGLYRHYMEHGKVEGRAPYAGYVAPGADKSTTSANDFIQADSILINSNASRIFVGDSRTYVMRNAVNDANASWIGFPGTRYDTFANIAAPIIDGMLLEGKQIIIMYGINDISAYGAKQSFENYNAFLNSKAQDWIKRGARVYFVSLVGMDYNLGINGAFVRPEDVVYVNNEVASFNNLMNRFPSNITKIRISVGKNAFYDGIHYTPDTCVSVYNQINRRL